MESGLGVLEAGLGVLESGMGVLEAGLGVLEARLGVLEAGLGVLERIKIEFKLRRGLKAKKHYFSIRISMSFVFPGYTELFPGHTELFPRQTDLLPGHTTWRLGGRTACLSGHTDSPRGSQNHFLAARIDSRGFQTLPGAPRSSQKLGKSIFSRF